MPCGLAGESWGRRRMPAFVIGEIDEHFPEILATRRKIALNFKDSVPAKLTPVSYLIRKISEF